MLIIRLVAMPDTYFIKFNLPLSHLPDRLDKVLARLMPEHSRSRIQAWIEQGHVQVNQQPARIRQRVNPGDSITVQPQASEMEQAFQAENININVIDQSPEWIVVNKPAGMVTHPGAGNWTGTLLNALLYHFPELANIPRAGIVHRLDKDTSGIMVVARTETSQTNLVRQLQARTMRREYQALVHGHIEGQGQINKAIGRDPHVPVRMTVENPIAEKQALTHYEVVRNGVYGTEAIRVSHVKCQLHTGRTHQIRVHLASIGHPILGDSLYGGKVFPGCQRQMLHATHLSFTNLANKEIKFEATPPSDFLNLCDQIWNQ